MLRKSIFIFVLAAVSNAAEKPNTADPNIHPYADPTEGRAPYRLASETVNESRLYDFYQRQADYYMSQSPGDIPPVLPAYPGLDAGRHGHWGKHNQNNHQDGRWNDIEIGSMLTQVFRRGKELTVLKGISLKLDREEQISTCFDPLTLAYRVVWTGGFVKFHPFRWGGSRNAELDGEPWFIDSGPGIAGAASRYLGLYRFGEQVIFSYQVGDSEILDRASAAGHKFIRTLQFVNGTEGGFRVKLGRGNPSEIEAKGDFEGRIKHEDGALWLEVLRADAGASVAFALDRDGSLKVTGADDLRPLIKGGKPAWPQTVSTKGELGEAIPGSAYITDTLTVPYENPYRSVMQLTSIAFDKGGSAYVATLAGEIWKVTGIDANLESLTWKRFASGFNQPIGIRIDPDGMFVLDRGQIYRLHDLNDDGEADFYENYAIDFGGYDRSHTHTFGLHRTRDGSFHFVQRESILKTGPDRKTVEQAWGVRNCMGIGGTDDYFWVAPQEGTWTPASAIIEVNEGEFYGLPKGGRSGTIATPLCFIPRGVDNSTGGMLEVTSDRWGPLKGRHIGLSYGSGLHYLILRDDSGSRPQGAVVPLEGEFLSGTMRGAFHPNDGQLYVAGLDGWGDYSVKDGCLHRVRFTGESVYKPIGFQVHSNGIRIDFPGKLDPAIAEDSSNFFAHVWNYEYANRYGSPEFSTKNPESLGHDQLQVRTVKLLPGASSIFVELPDLEPVMQLHIRMHLRSSDGQAFKSDLFASPMFPGEHFSAEGLAEAKQGKSTAVALRVKSGENAKPTGESGTRVEGERALLVEATGGLQYVRKQLHVRAGEPLALKLQNTDVMPHNLVILKPGATEKVGEASFAMLNDPDAGKKHYVPELPEVLCYIPVINPSSEHTLHFRAPEKPGDYPYICTFPGHWQAMRGVLKVRK